MINKMEMGRKNGQMALTIRGNTNLGKSMAWANSYGQTHHSTKENFAIITSRAVEFTNGLTGGSLMASGKIIRWMERGYLFI
jgi:hypothetical protein